MSPARQPRYAAIAYLLLASIYLLYLPHAEFLLDDWFVLGKYQAAREAGRAEQVRVFTSYLQNRFHDQFRFQWLSFSLGYLIWLLVGYTAPVVFAVFLLSHLGCAVVWRQVLERLGIGPAAAFLTGAVFLLLPTTHGALFWSFNCLYYVWSTFWFLLYLRALAPTLVSGVLDRKAAIRQALFLLLALFSGDPIFALLVAGAPLAAWFLQSKAGVRATLLAWATVGVAATLYALLMNKARMLESGVGLRYDFSAASLKANLLAIFHSYRRLTGVVGDAYYHLRPTAAAVMAGVAAAAAVTFWLRGTGGRPCASVKRALLLAGCLWLAAYGPILFLKGHELRYSYVPSPYLALALSILVFALPGARLALAAALAGWMAAAAVADIQQCWIPQSRNLRALAEKLRPAHRLEPGDLIIVSNTPLWMGTAPHFALHSGGFAEPFAEHVSGIRNLKVGTDIVSEEGRLRVFDPNYMRDLEPGENLRTRVLVTEPAARLGERRLLAEQVGPNAFRLYPLKGYTGPAPSHQPFTREQLVLLQGEIYFARAYSHRAHAH